MKIVKLPKRLLKRGCYELLKHFDLYNTSQVFPEQLYVSKEDAKFLRRELKKLYKKEYPYAYSKKIEAGVGMHWLNYGPNEKLADVLKPGYALIVTSVDEVNFEGLLERGKV